MLTKKRAHHIPALKIVSTAVHPVKRQRIVRSATDKDLFFIFI
jgi:hypothetical protein